MRKSVIRLDRDLPARPRVLNAKELSSIFGGCPSVGELCYVLNGPTVVISRTCCPGLLCRVTTPVPVMSAHCR
jgi:hypothetical protein